MNKVWTHIALVIALLILAAAAIYPPEKNLRLGKDLAGGVSLTYSVLVAQDVPDRDRDAAIENMIAVLVDRVNPTGTLDITFTRVGSDRVEITMPLPTDRVKQLQAEYLAELEKVEAFELPPDVFASAVRARGQARLDALAALADTPQRQAMLAPVIEAAQAIDEADREASNAARALDQAEQAGYPDGNEAELRDALDQARRARDEAQVPLDREREKALDQKITANDVRQVLQLSDESVRVRIREGEDRFYRIPSERTRRLQAIRERVSELPGAAELLGAPGAPTSLAEAERLAKEADSDEIEEPGSLIRLYDAYDAEREALDDPNDLKRLLQGSGVLEFRIAATTDEDADFDVLREQLRTVGPLNVESDRYVWRPINKESDWFDTLTRARSLRENPAAYFAARNDLVAEAYAGTVYLLMHDTDTMSMTQSGRDGAWGVTTVFPSQDPRTGRPALSFVMNPRGASLLSDLTGPNVDRPMAVVLDGRVYTAPRINTRLSNSVQVTGDFSPAEIQYLIKTLQAGSLRATLSPEPISENTIAPELGSDNLRRGLDAGQWALLTVGVFMVGYYFAMGLVAMLCLAANGLLILAAMAMAQTSFTLPGIAGVVLTFGMAVDANVLIYERIREELNAGEDLRAAVRLAYKRVFSTIVDANITNLIVCLVLFYAATQEVKGFAVTLGIGVIATMFSALVLSRLIFAALVDRIRVRKMAQLPVVIPFIDKLLTPNIDWIKLRPVFIIVSAALLGFGGWMIYTQRGELLDTEFRGGTVVDISLQAEDGSALTLQRAQVQDRVHAIGDAAQARVETGETDDQTRQLAQLAQAEVIAVNPEADGVTSERFQIKVIAVEPTDPGQTSPDPDPDQAASELAIAQLDPADQNLAQAVVDAISEEFAGEIAAQAALTFQGHTEPDIRFDAGLPRPPVYEISRPTLGDNDIPGLEDLDRQIGEYVGGFAILFQNFSPSPTESELRDRLLFARTQDPSGVVLRRDFELIVLSGTSQAVDSALILVNDPGVYGRNRSRAERDAYRQEVIQQEWDLAREALTDRTTLAGVQSFSPSIAASFRDRAILAVALSFLLILAYIWIRFGSPRYSLAAIVALVHDVIAVIGLIAAAEIIFALTDGASAKYGIQPFKIDLGLVAALLTIIGYSLNDTIIILDRVRENRGRLNYASRKVVNLAINQTISRTVITSGTTLIALIVLFTLGGEGIASFTYALLCGVLVGTYSSVAIAAPLVYSAKVPPVSSFRGTPDADAQPGSPNLPEPS